MLKVGDVLDRSIGSGDLAALFVSEEDFVSLVAEVDVTSLTVSGIDEEEDVSSGDFSGGGGGGGGWDGGDDVVGGGKVDVDFFTGV